MKIERYYIILKIRQSVSKVHSDKKSKINILKSEFWNGEFTTQISRRKDEDIFEKQTL